MTLSTLKTTDAIIQKKNSVVQCTNDDFLPGGIKFKAQLFLPAELSTDQESLQNQTDFNERLHAAKSELKAIIVKQDKRTIKHMIEKRYKDFIRELTYIAELYNTFYKKLFETTEVVFSDNPYGAIAVYCFLKMLPPNHKLFSKTLEAKKEVLVDEVFENHLRTPHGQALLSKTQYEFLLNKLSPDAIVIAAATAADDDDLNDLYTNNSRDNANLDDNSKQAENSESDEMSDTNDAASDSDVLRFMDDLSQQLGTTVRNPYAASATLNARSTSSSLSRAINLDSVSARLNDDSAPQFQYDASRSGTPTPEHAQPPDSASPRLNDDGALPQQENPNQEATLQVPESLFAGHEFDVIKTIAT